jgi:dethiobiotin synthetase/adenosylmethionine--8-amino-7-oxononanoate aminotransferase
MADSAHKVIWYPFTQHRDLSASDITVIDSAHEDCFHTLKPASPIRKKTSKAGKGSGDGPKEPNSLLQSTFDGSASWWTQGLGHANPELALTSAYAAGRYGHIIFAGTIHDPALSLAELLLRSSQNPRLQRVFFSDNGSTGMEVAVKMALRAVTRRYGSNVNGTQSDIGILGLRGSYHGDTMGAMDCSEPSTFNQKVEWYQGRGYWFDFPTVKMVKGAWTVSMPGSMGKDPGDSSRFPCLPAIFDLEARKNSDLASRYQTYIRSSLEKLAVQDGRRFGALIIEPVILGAGGMLFAWVNCSDSVRRTS